MREKLHAKRAAAEEHIKELERRGRAGTRYTIMMPDMPFMVLGLICDMGWLLQLIFGVRMMSANRAASEKTLVIIDMIMILTGILYTIYLGKIHEKEIALRHQKDLSFGLTALGGVLGIVFGAAFGNAGMLIGGILNTAGGLPIYLSFRKGIRYGVC